ncbi:GGDEF domain-containing protein [Agrobacterium radiobacter]|uniref:diguanylate cyclase n=3 Tax=Agrobacterium tumefaciens complex TaxID=1183400 RepID=A0AAP9E6K7_AGRTU|nr:MULTISPECIES: GGDEF domain-containing protein [Agrobacterium tumefaciens complex]MCP2135165.1 diguanylate cyclase [Rhizobium sp. SLBN-94]AYM04995.1 diguanylate cyclase [Agrobacterium tumefaciens]EPR07292.1 diguanylate-cyclase [Agrobacterium radiobacter DSM 30147]KWT80207.1 diguanylate-cyclase [Agrobacterium radiobacter]KWT86390.1 diguanylate-cyclase [Agrobacterium tumefaciens str. B6]
MTTSAGDKKREHARSALVVTKITQFIAKMNIAPLPRNYELIYEILSGHNPAMGRDILALGNAPQQHEIDLIGQRHNLPGFSRIEAEQMASEAFETLTQISVRLDASLHRTETFMSSLEQDEDGEPPAMERFVELLGDIREEQTSLRHFIAMGLVKIREVERNRAELQAASLRDALTALPNRAAFLEKLGALFAKDRAASATSLVLLDIDHFREINGKYGSSAGNKALRRLAALFRKTIKKDDFVARIGGDEFAFLFAGVPQNTAEAIAERLRQSVEALRFATTGGDGEHLTVSIGVAEVDGTATPAEFFGHAELALLSARCGARNCVVGYSREVSQHSRSSYLAQLGS